MSKDERLHRIRPSTGDPRYYRTAAALPYVNPTRALVEPNIVKFGSEDAPSSTRAASYDLSQPGQSKSLSPAVAYKWTSRNNRKGRHAVTIHPSRIPSEWQHLAPRPTSSWRNTVKGIWRMITVYPIWDISYDVATVFTLGSVVWVINAFFVYLPRVAPNTEFKHEELYGGGITAFIGVNIFVVGSILLAAEAINEDITGCFGWALECVFAHDSEKGSSNSHRLQPSQPPCAHHHQNRNNLIGQGNATASQSTHKPNSRTWTWFPSREELRTHYLRELGFLASVTQLVAALIFWISGFTALPGIYTRMSRTVTIVLYWTPQVIGGSGFILSGTLFMLETQSRWYKPAFKTLGWWVGAWNLIGGIGFTLCPAFGYNKSSWAQYQACLSTFWGSWAFLFGSVLQWYESLEKWPVEVVKSKDPRSEDLVANVGKERHEEA